jgi:thiol-disulfide isomerase/thioredoxin
VLAVIYSCNNNKSTEKNDEKDLTVISGKIDNANDRIVKLSYNSTTDTIQLNENGEFTAKILLKEPSHLVIVNGGNHARIYVNPKSKLNLTVKAENFYETLKFTGDDADINNYLAKQVAFIVKLGINSESFLYASKYETFAKALQGMNDILNDNLNQFANGNEKYADFANLERERFKIMSGTLLLTFYTPLINTNQNNKDIESSIDNLVTSTDLNNPMMIQLYEFKPFVQNLAAYELNKQLKAENRQIASAPEYAEMYFTVLDRIFNDPIVLEELYYSYIKDFAGYYGAESVVGIYSKYKDFSSNKQRLSELEKIFAGYDNLAAGNASVNWSFPDINGKMVSLSDFKGKYVYIDVWASWCGPCKQEIPYLKSLKDKFKGKNIEIIGISVDENKTDWENIMKSESLTGIQLFAAGWENTLCESFKITGIPRFILIDKQGKIINSNADRPSGDIETVLNGLEGI